MFGTFVGDDPAITARRATRGPQVPFRERLPARPDPRRVRPQDEQVARATASIRWTGSRRFGADALRFTLARGASPGGDLSIGEDHARASRNFATKLFNATRFALMNGASPAPLPDVAELTDADRWILGRLEEVRAEVDSAFDSYEFSRACESLYHFAWDEFCDWYLELAKVQLRRRCHAHHRGAGRRAGHAAQAAAPGDAVRHRGAVEDADRWRVAGDRRLAAAVRAIALDPVAAQRVADMQKLITEVRRFRSDQGLNDRQRVPARLSGVDDRRHRRSRSPRSARWRG